MSKLHRKGRWDLNASNIYHSYTYTVSTIFKQRRNFNNFLQNETSETSLPEPVTMAVANTTSSL